MSRTFYSEYVNHCLRFYARHDRPKFHSEADKHNWAACDSALKSFSDNDRAMLLYIYREGDTVPEISISWQSPKVSHRTAFGSS